MAQQVLPKERYRKWSLPYFKLVAFFVGTSLFGLFLVCVAVYNGSAELEVMHDVDNLHRSALLMALPQTAAAPQTLPRLENVTQLLSSPQHEVYCLSATDECQSKSLFMLNEHLGLAQLEATRISERGGHFTVGDAAFSWAGIAYAEGKSLILLHRHQTDSLSRLAYAYRKHALIPAVFYLWLMVWVSFILINMVNQMDRDKQRMEHMALHDALSGLPNRAQLSARLCVMLQDKAAAFALVVVDLDRFKAVNDTHGHEAGDELIKQVAGRLKQALRTGDMAARTGGDEFVLLLNKVNQTSCFPVCERVRQDMCRKFSLQKQDVNIGASLGVAIFPADGQDAEMLMRRADAAMYCAKVERNGIRFHIAADAASQPTQQELVKVP
jgi:diguanylate cyclase (GGDEF)-like protein